MVSLRKQRFCGRLRAKRSIAARGDQGDGRVTTGGAKNSACTTKGQISNRKKDPCRFRQGLEKVPTMFQNVIFNERTVLKASPGPMPGAPLKSPIVSVTWPEP
jgi:hypothetical protein